VRQTLGLPAQKAVEGAGFGAYVVAGHDLGPRQLRQGVHQLQSDAVVALGSHPDAYPHIAPCGVGADIPRCAQIAAILLGHDKLRHTVAPRVVVAVKLRAVDEWQAHIKILVDKVNDRAFLARGGMTKDSIRQWQSLL